MVELSPRLPIRSVHRIANVLRAEEVGRREFLLLVSIIVGLPSLALALFVHKFGVNVIINDEWDMVPLYQKMVMGSLNLADLFSQHNEHRIFFPRIAMLTIERLTSFNTVAEMYLSWALLTGTVAIVFYMFWRSNGSRRNLGIVLWFLPASFLMFSFRQEEAILWGFTSQIYVAVSATVIALFLLGNAKPRKEFLRFALSILGGVVASYSFLLGLVVWPAGVIQIVFTEGRNNKIRRLLLWCLSGAIVAGLYLHDFQFPPSTLTLYNPLRFAEYYFAFLGAPFTFELAYFSASIGILVVIIAVFILYQVHKIHLMKVNGFWISIIFFVALSATLTTLGRFDLGTSQALSSRYTPITILGVVALYSIAIQVSRYRNVRGTAFCRHALLTLILLGLIVSTGAGWHIGQQTRLDRQMATNVLQNYQQQPDNNIVKYLNLNSTLVRIWASYLKAEGLNVFAHNKPAGTSRLAVCLVALSLLYSWLFSGKYDLKWKILCVTLN